MPTKLTVDFRGATPSFGGGPRRDYIEPGKHRFEIVDVGNKKSNSGKEMATISFAVTNGEEKGKRTVEYFVVERTGDEVPVGIQRLLAMMECAGIKNPNKRVSMDLDLLIGKKVEAEVIPDDDYNGRPQSRIGSFIKATGKSAAADEDEEEEEEEADDEEEEEEAPPKKTAKKRRAQEEDEDEDEESDDDEDEDFPF